MYADSGTRTGFVPGRLCAGGALVGGRRLGDTGRVMSQTNLEIAGQVFAAFNAGELDAMIEVAHPEIEIVPLRAAVEETSYRGREAIPDFWGDMMEAWEQGLHVDVHGAREMGDRVVVLGRLVGRGAESGAEVEAELGWVLGMRDAKVFSLRTFANPADALEAVGLAE